MRIGVISLFPEMFAALDFGIVGRAQEKQLLSIQHWNPRDFAHDKHRTVDDRPYGGGPGMVMMVEPLRGAIRAARQTLGEAAHVIYLSPQGRRLTQADLPNLVTQQPLVLLAGRYEGIDERLLATDIDAEWSIGDYVLSGGELAAMVMIDAMARLLPGVVGDEESVRQDSFSNLLLDCPHYTRPVEIDGQIVPSVLLSGDHQAITRWRLKQSLGRTWLRRPDLLASRPLSVNEQALLDEFILEMKAVED